MHSYINVSIYHIIFTYLYIYIHVHLIYITCILYTPPSSLPPKSWGPLLKAAKPVGTSVNFKPNEGDKSPGQR